MFYKVRLAELYEDVKNWLHSYCDIVVTKEFVIEETEFDTLPKLVIQIHEKEPPITFIPLGYDFPGFFGKVQIVFINKVRNVFSSLYLYLTDAKCCYTDFTASYFCKDREKATWKVPDTDRIFTTNPPLFDFINFDKELLLEEIMERN